MILTHAEDRLRTLLKLWLLLFTAGVVVLLAAMWLDAGQRLYRTEPLLVYTLLGQTTLLLSSLYLFSGIRDNELAALAITWFKLVSATAMLPLWWGAALDYAMGGATLVLWLMARRSRAERLPDLAPLAEQESTGPEANRLRISLAVVGALCGLAMLAFLIRPAPQDAVAKIATANAAATYAALSLLAFSASKAPRRRAFTMDIVVGVSVFAAVVLTADLLVFAPGGPWRGIIGAGAAAHLVMAVVIVELSSAAARVERPTALLGPWLHRVLERFAEVILKGDIEVVTAREIADQADRLLAQVRSPRVDTIKLALSALELAALLRYRAPMSRMGRLEREDYLTEVFQRGRGVFRSLIRVKQLVFLIYYSDPRAYQQVGFTELRRRAKYQEAEQQHNLPSGPVAYPQPVTAGELEADVCVIGSGAGGAVVAARLAEAGLRVALLEEGPFLKRDRVNQDERAMQVQAYREGGLQLTLDFQMYVLQGRCVGGSTFLNNGICFALPEAARKKWEALGASLDVVRLNESFARVRRDLQLVDLAQRRHLVERGSLKFMEGCAGLGLPAGWFEVNLDGCIGCGYCTLGCAFEKKLSTDLSYVPRALAAGAALVAECKALRLNRSGAKIASVECLRGDGSEFRARARKFVVACGAVGSSLLLLRSGITRNVGTRLSFNLGSWVFAEFDEAIDCFDGIQMCAYHEGPGYTLETIAMPPGVFAATMPGWFQDHFHNMMRYRHLAMAGALVGSEAVGRVRSFPLPVLKRLLSPIDFRLPASDLRRLKDGVRQVCRIFLGAGARRVIPATFYPLQFFDPGEVHLIDEMVAESDDISFGSSHPQGGNPMSDDRRVGAVDSRFRVHDFDNLYVCDASVFPASIQANPQLTIMALADYASAIIAE